MRKLIVILVAMSSLASLALGASPEGREPDPAFSGPGTLLTSNGTAGIAARETTGPDTFVLYGGPDHPTEGKFQLANGTTPDWGGGNGLPGGHGGGPDAWRPVDLTKDPVYWRQSTFNAENLNNNGPGNNAFWCGAAPDDPFAADWVAPPGVGNDWFEYATYESAPLVDPSVGQVVDLEFFFNYDLYDDTWDFFLVQYDLGGVWTNVLAVTGTSPDGYGVFPAPGKLFSDYQFTPIAYAGNDYGGEFGDQIRIRLLVTSDGAWSDQDGNAPSVAGAAQIDDITLTTSQGTFTEDFEGPGPYLFVPHQSNFAGDFTDVYGNLTDLDPCRSNSTPVVGFIDYGQEVRNGPGIGGTTSTGGSTSYTTYGIQGNYVFNYTDGLSGGEFGVQNEVWSPEILWDLPGPDDDEPDFAGAVLRFSAMLHVPSSHGIALAWRVRSARAGEPYGPWVNDNRLIMNTYPVWGDVSRDVTHLLEYNAERVQVSIGAWDYFSSFGTPAATPGPWIDNVSVQKYRLAGPVITGQLRDLAQDGFPVSGSIDVSSPAARDALDIPFDMARDINASSHLLPLDTGDSIIVDVTGRIPGAFPTDRRMVWALKTNPVFEDAIRSAPSRTRDENVATGAAGTIWTGEVVAGYTGVNNRYFFDLPDVDFMYPGDVLHYYIQATDNQGRVSTLPHDTSGFMDFAPTTAFDRAYTVRGLPTITDTAGSQPELLVYNDFGRLGNEAAWLGALQQLGYEEGVDFDSYTNQSPAGFGYSTGLGSAGGHGATVDQIAGYHHMFYLAGTLRNGLLSDGTDDDGALSYNDKSNDVGLMEAWHLLPGTRNAAHFGSRIAHGMATDGGAYGYLVNTLGVDYQQYEDVLDWLGGSISPVLAPDAAGPYASTFSTTFVANSNCVGGTGGPLFAVFDWINPRAGAYAGHLFLDASGIPIPPNPNPELGAVASVIKPRANGYDVTVPVAVQHIISPHQRSASLPARAELFAEIFDLFGAPPGGIPVAVPSVQRVELSIAPNPFNPTTVVKFTALAGSPGSVKVFNLRGELVRTLHSGEFTRQEFQWDGVDTRGAPVASGVYLIRATDGATTQTQKVALVK